MDVYKDVWSSASSENKNAGLPPSDANVDGTSNDILIDFYQSDNICEYLSDQELAKIGEKCVKYYNIDKQSRSEWDEQYKEILKIAKQVKEDVSYPWAKAANVKMPLIPVAVINFASRLYSEVLNGNDVIKTQVEGDDPQGQLSQIAQHIQHYMTYQLLVETDTWESETDKLFNIVGLAGTAFKKTYYDPICKLNRSETCSPDEIFIHQNSKSAEEARRITHVIHKHNNDIIELQRAGYYREVSLHSLGEIKDDNLENEKEHVLLEQHCWLDLDGDGYQEPYIVIVHEQSRQVLSIQARYDTDGIHFVTDKAGKETKEISYIDPVHYFTDFHCIPSPDGKFYSIGLGTILYAINAASNSLTNQMLDAGTLANLPYGLIGKGLRLKGGIQTFTPGEFKVAEGASGDDLKKGIYEFQFQGPSQVLLSLLELLLTSGKELAAISDTMLGAAPNTNTPATSTLATLQQGLMTYGAIQKRIFRSLKKEFDKLFRLNSLYLDSSTYQKDGVVFHVSKEMFNSSNITVKPVADPNQSSDAQKLLKAQAIMTFAQTLPNTLQPAWVANEFLSALKYTQTEIQAALPPKPAPNAPPPLDQQELQAKIEHMKEETKHTAVKSQVLQADTQLKGKSVDIDQQKVHLDAIKVHHDVESDKADKAYSATQLAVDVEKAKVDHAMKHHELNLKEKDIDNKAAANARKPNGSTD